MLVIISDDVAAQATVEVYRLHEAVQRGLHYLKLWPHCHVDVFRDDGHHVIRRMRLCADNPDHAHADVCRHADADD